LSSLRIKEYDPSRWDFVEKGEHRLGKPEVKNLWQQYVQSRWDFDLFVFINAISRPMSARYFYLMSYDEDEPRAVS